MKKILFLVLIMILILNTAKIGAEKESVTPQRLMILGGVAVGIEVVYNIVKLFIDDKKDDRDDMDSDSMDTNVTESEEMQELEKYNILKKLTVRSRLFDVIEGRDNISEQTNE